MRKEEKMLLEKMKEYKKGLLESTELFTIIGENKSEKLIHQLISMGYIDELPIQEKFLGKYQQQVFRYRLSKQGVLVFEPWLVRAWVFFTNDMAKILSIIAIIISILVGLRQMGWI